jgi:predicted metal-dependent phosphotriesterase family hydrolase
MGHDRSSRLKEELVLRATSLTHHRNALPLLATEKAGTLAAHKTQLFRSQSHSRPWLDRTLVSSKLVDRAED